jgi:hypothetical protein
MAQRIDVSSDRERAALRSIRDLLARLRDPSRLFRIRSRLLGLTRETGLFAVLANRKSAPAAVKARGFAYLAALEERYGPIPSTANEAALALDAMVFDRSALLALARGNVPARRAFERALVADVRMVAPATVLLDARAFGVARDISDIVDIVAIDAEIAMAAARLVAVTGIDLPFDALTVACVPLASRAAFVTADGPGVGTFARATEREGSVWIVNRPTRQRSGP